MNINNLINRYGEKGQRNNVNISVFVDEERLSSYKREVGFKDSTSLVMLAVLLKEQVADTDVFLINGTQYRVFQSKEIRVKGVRVYSDVILFKDDFIHDIEVLKQSLNTKGCNLPSIKPSNPIVLKGRIKTTSQGEYLQYALHSDKTPSHVISVLFNGSDIEVMDLIQWGNRAFEVLGTENINEQNRVLVISTVEVLNG